MAFNPNQLMQMQAFPPRQMPPQAQAYGGAPGIYQMQPQQMQAPPQQVPQQQMPPQMPPQMPQGSPNQQQGGVMRDWRALRPQHMQGMDPAQWRTQMQDWQGQRPQRGGMDARGLVGQMGQQSPEALAGRHFAQLQQARQPQPQATNLYAHKRIQGGY